MRSAKRAIAALREWIVRLWGSVSGRRRDGELEQELRLHLELAAAAVDPVEALKAE